MIDDPDQFSLFEDFDFIDDDEQLLLALNDLPYTEEEWAALKQKWSDLNDHD